MNKIRILLADDHALIRECLASILSRHPHIEIVTQVDNGSDAVRLTRELQPDVVLMDISMTGVNGIEATRRISQDSPGVKVMMLSVYSDPRYVVESLNAGALGFLAKSCLTTELVQALHSVAQGKIYLSPELRRIVGVEPQQRSASLLAMTTLTPREREVLVLLAEGKSYGEIADLLEISWKTVETHRVHIMKKLNVKNMADLTKYAIREGLLLLD